MKKSIKRLVAVLVVMTMIVTMCSTALAAGHGNKKSSQGSYKSYTKEVTEETTVTYPATEDTVSYPAFSDTQSASDIDVAVNAPEGAFPDGTSLDVSEVASNEVEDAAADIVNGEIADIAAVNISFINNDSEIEPAEGTEVDVVITSPALKEGGEPSVVHIKDDGTAEPVTAVIDQENGTATFKSGTFSTYALVWTVDGSEKSATIHWGTYEDGEFTELTAPTAIDSTASSVDLEVIIDAEKYYFVGAEYKLTEDAEESENLKSTVLHKVNGKWQISLENSGTVDVADGSHIFVNYAPYGEGGYTPPVAPGPDVLAPDTEKTVTDNGDGTFTVQLDIEGKADHSTTQVGANVIVVMDITQSMTNRMPGSTATRMAAAKQALTTLIDTLDPDTNLINFTAVNFGNSANYYNGVNWTTSKTAMTNYVSGLPNNPNDFGTCWQAGLQGGIDRVGTAPAGNQTYVIFVTDGNPNCYTDARGNWHASTGPNFNQASYNAAVSNANALGSSSHFYGVFVGDADGYDHLDDLITNANGVKTINGTSESTLREEFGNIAQTIVNNLGAGGVTVDDGIPTLSNVSANVSAGEAGGFEYYIKPALASDYTTWSDAPGASYSQSNGVTWDLGEAGELQNGTIYRLRFTVWPSQAAYDLIADLNNGIKDYDDLTPEQQASVQGSKEAGYTLLTNTHLYTTFKDLDGKEYREVNDASAEAMPLPTETISVEKLWHNYLDSRDDQDIDGLQMVLSRDEEEYLEFDVSSPSWKKDNIYISCGQIVDGEIVETGHDYYVTEKAPESGVDKTDYWEVNSPVYHPMVVNGTMHMYIQDDSASSPAFEFNGHKYVLDDSSEAATLSAINERVSWLNLTKTVTGEGADPNQLFEYKIKITEPTAENTVYFSVRGGGVNYRDDIETSATKWVDTTTGNTYYTVASGTEFTLKLKAGWNARFLNLDTDSTYSIEETKAQLADGWVLDSAQTVETLYSARGTAATGYPITTTEENPTQNGAVVSGETVTGKINQTNTDYSVTYANKYLGNFYIYHSSDNTIEKLPMATKGEKVTDFNIFAKTKDDTLYGGYYRAYAGAAATDAQINETAETGKITYTDGWGEDTEGCSPYDYAYIKSSGKAAWDNATDNKKAYTDSGTAMDPVAGTVYYLKEVPTGYLQPYTYYTYYKADPQNIADMWAISDLDDLNYTDTGFYITDVRTQATNVVSTLSIKAANSSTTVKLTAYKAFYSKGVKDGYLSYAKISDKIGSEIMIQQYWITPDAIEVFGIQQRKLDTTTPTKAGLTSEDSAFPNP